MPDASPTKWHLAHTAWFFEAVVLSSHDPGYEPFDQRFFHLFNSYYESLGPRHPRPHRGLLTRPSHDEVMAYRGHVDRAMLRFMETADDETWAHSCTLVELGLNHEEQHQELILTDILHAFSCNPLLPAYSTAYLAADSPASTLAHAAPDAPSLRLVHGKPGIDWVSHPGGIVNVGHAGEGFAFDNETPRHKALLAPYLIADRLVNCGEYAAFIADGGYERASLWLSDGWAAVQAGGWKAPIYWIAPGDPRAPSDEWQVFGLAGVRPLDHASPVTQLSFYEACAYALWAGARLPTEFEWEAALSAPEHGRVTQMTGHAWQWTRSSYDPYPGFKPNPGAVAEYNGKFMVSQLVLRGGSSATPHGHTRATYRNFFPPATRWQFSGVRLAKDAAC